MAAGAVAALTGCSTQVAPVQQYSAPATVSADIRDLAGTPKAVARAMQVGDAIRLQVTASNMPTGTYGAHVHTTGRCDAPTFDSAGAHWNPTNHRHGKNNPAGMHKGDLPNLVVGADGRGSMEVTLPNASLTGALNRLMDADGAALVVHASADDYRTDPSGNSGGRIACGVFR